MSYTLQQSSIRTIPQDDPKFRLRDGLLVGQRAGFEIMASCPQEYRNIVAECLSRGWVRPVAYMHDYEMTFAILKDQQ